MPDDSGLRLVTSAWDLAYALGLVALAAGFLLVLAAAAGQARPWQTVAGLWLLTVIGPVLLLAGSTG